MSTPRFHTIGLLGRLHDPAVHEPAATLATHLRARGVDVRIIAEADARPPLADLPSVPESQFGAECDLVVAVGGDGTMLYASRLLLEHDVPLVGVNRGRLGFLTDISPDSMAAHLDSILAGRYVAERRQMLEARIEGAHGSTGPGLALNEVALQKHLTGHMLDFVTHVDGKYLNSHGGDGLIVATATGSTAYALSCGGPIIQPELEAMVLVPVCPHTLSDRPLVLPARARIEARIKRRLDTRATVSCDGELLGELGPNDTLHIATSARQITLLHPEGYDFYEILRSKLNWGHDSRYRRDDI